MDTAVKVVLEVEHWGIEYVEYSNILHYATIRLTYLNGEVQNYESEVTLAIL